MAYLSHIVGVVQTPPSVITVGPDSGNSQSSPNTWTSPLPSQPVQDTKFLILHFTQAKLPGNNRIEVDLGYDTDVFHAADGTDFWTRPVNVKALNGAPVIIRYITDGATTGSVQLDKFGVGERHVAEQPGHSSLTNCDPFFSPPAYIEPIYDPFWYCTNPPNWENVECVTGPNDVRARVTGSVGMIITVEDPIISTCTVTLIDSNEVITAGHCHTPDQALTSSITFDYQTACDGSQLPNYHPRFYKVKAVLDHEYDSNGDFSRLQLATAVTGVFPLQLRPDLPGVGEQIFGIHHPNGAVKKLSVPHPSFDTVITSSASAIQVPSTFHVSGGSSGSALFDTAGRVLGVLSNGAPCQGVPLIYFPASSILNAIAPAPPTPVTRDVMIVFDRSGSMTQLDVTGRTKIEVARDAVSLFVQLIRPGVGNRVGLVSFSTTATSPADFAITSVTAASKQNLIGPPPFAAGKVGGLTPGGSTSIGDGLDKARQQFPVPGANPRAILLMTDGMQNTPPFLSAVEGMLTGIDVDAVGLGTDGNLNGQLLSDLASSHNGVYNRAGSGVSLQKFFSHAFGNIFETGVLHDPEFDLPAGQNASSPFSFDICGEDAVTVAVGWDKLNATLAVELVSPQGATVTGASSNVEEAVGRTWTFLRVPLPRAGERDGVWNATVFRSREGSPVPLHYFINVIPTGGARLLRARDDRTYYTGDAINPLVLLRFADGSWPTNPEVQMTLSRPNASIGNILSQSGLLPPVSISGDTLPSRQATISDIIQRTGGPVTTFVDETFVLSNFSSSTNGTFEEAGIFGNPLTDKLVTEGDYTFHFRATYGEGCTATRELLWSLHIDIGVDPAHTSIDTNFTGTLPDGRSTGVVTIVPGDRYGNQLGPGRSDGVTISGSAGTTVTGPIVDNGDGSYTIPIAWNPASGNPPGVIIGQPGRPPVVSQQPGRCEPPKGGDHCDGDGHDCECHGGHDGGQHGNHNNWSNNGGCNGRRALKRSIDSDLIYKRANPDGAVVPVLIILLVIFAIFMLLRRRRRHTTIARPELRENEMVFAAK